MNQNPENYEQGLSRQSYELRELLTPGHEACPGCGAAMALRLALKSLGPDCALVVPQSCVSSWLGPFPYTAARVATLHAAAGTAAASASGVRAAFDLSGREGTVVVAWGDRSDAFGQGLAHLMMAAGRNERIIYVCCDSGAPDGGDSPLPIDVIGALGGRRIPYYASTTPALPLDLDAKFRTARSTGGFCFLHVLAACPSRWKIDPSRSVEAMRGFALSGSFEITELRGPQANEEKGR